MDLGVTVPPWSGRRRAQAIEYVRRRGEAEGAACVLCDQAIDYSLRYPHPQSCSVQHVRSQRDFPLLRWDPANWAPAHLDCNWAAGARGRQDLGLMTGS